MSIDLPRTSHNFIQERTGVNAVAHEVNRMQCIWRETPMQDVGIDGQIEFVSNEGFVTGQILAVQVKSGLSYFHDYRDEWRFYPDDKHRFYWERFPIPVLIMLHNPETNITYWADARKALRTPQSSELRYIAVRKKSQLRKTTREQLFFNSGGDSERILTIEEVLNHLIKTNTANNSFPLTYLDLFANGLINITRSLYFNMDLATQIVEFHVMNESNSELDCIPYGFGHSEYNFLFGYIKFLVQQHIADIDFSDCLIDWYDQELVPRFVAPLTNRGRQLVKLISETQDSLDEQLNYPSGIRVAQEGLIQVLITPSHIQRISLIKKFEKLLIQE